VAAAASPHVPIQNGFLTEPRSLLVTLACEPRRIIADESTGVPKVTVQAHILDLN
jgi:ABC-type phosphonate transport system ATPase subunit